jgi:DNA-binding CsgD family transcriptional regulator
MPFVPGAAFGEYAAFSHDEFSSDVMCETTIATVPIAEREFGSLAELLTNSGPTFDMNALLGPRGLERMQIFNEHWRPHRLDRQIVAVFGSGSQFRGTLGVSRSARQASFGSRDLERLDKIRLRLSGPLERLILAEQRGCEPVLLMVAAGLPQPSVLFDSRGQVLWASAAAERLGIVRGSAGWVVPCGSVEFSAWRALALESLVQGRVTAQLDDVLVQRIEVRPGVPVALVTQTFQRETIDMRVFAATRKHNLTPRESEILLRVASGLSNKEIAHELGSSVRTVEGHVVNILKKCGCSSRTELVARL